MRHCHAEMKRRPDKRNMVIFRLFAPQRINSHHVIDGGQPPVDDDAPSPASTGPTFIDKLLTYFTGKPAKPNNDAAKNSVQGENKNCSNCVECSSCVDCASSAGCSNCENCLNCSQCDTCVDCTNCGKCRDCLLYTSPSPRDGLLSRMPSSA